MTTASRATLTAEQTATYLDALRPDGGPDWLTISTVEQTERGDAWRTIWTPVADHDLAAYHIRRLAEDDEQNVFVGVAGRDRDAAVRIAQDAERERAQREHRQSHGITLSHIRGAFGAITSIPAFYCELDIAGAGHAETALPPDLDAVLVFLDRLPLKPSMVIHSGGGIHPYWLLREQWQFDGADEQLRAADERLHAQDWLKRWERTIHDTARELHGWKFDPVADLPRVLRPAGTWNRKPKYPQPRLVTILDLNSTRYNPSDFEPYLAPAVVRPQRSASHANGTRPAAGHLLDAALRRIADGAGRNNTGFWLACQCRDNTYTREETTAILLDFQERVGTYNSRGEYELYTTDEAAGSVASAFSGEARQPWEPRHASVTAAPPSGDPPATPATSSAPAPATALTDLGNAERFIRQHGENVRYVPRWKRWLVWDGRRWAPDDTHCIQQRAIETVRSIYAEAAASPDDGDRKAIAKHAVRSESDGKIKAMLSLAESLPGVAVAPEVFDADPWLLNCANGTLDLRTGDLHPHRREDLITKLSPVPYDANAQAPTWERFLQRITDGNDRVIGFKRRSYGYSLTGHTGEECLFFCYGTGRNGKSKELGAIEYILGDYARPTKPDVFMDRKAQGGATNDLADLAGARFVPTIETGEGGRLAEGLLKWITGSDTVKARFLFSENFTFRPAFKLWLAGNHKPTIRGSDEGIWSRIKLIPFTVVIPEAERDRDLGAKLEAEAPGILAWAVQGCLEWQIHGLGVPDEVREATQAYREEQDVFGGFLSDCCTVAELAAATAKNLFERYEQWCKDNGMTPANSTWFGRKLGERGFRKVKSNGVISWHGLTVKTQGQ